MDDGFVKWAFIISCMLFFFGLGNGWNPTVIFWAGVVMVGIFIKVWWGEGN